MRRALIMMVLGVLCTAHAQSQAQPGYVLPNLDRKPPVTRTGVITVHTNSPLLLLGPHETDYASLVVDPREIKVVQAYKDSALLAPLGAKAKNGVLAIELKNKKPLLNLTDVLDYFEVPASQRQLRVLLNKQPVSPNRFLADIKRIAKIEVITIDKTHPIRLSWDENEQFLNIVTVDQALPQ